ncbi:MAG: aspartate--ammonia ligase [Eubacterium sp.]|nr:aspartate--ammonia ligase [Eubacterium sp.]MBR7060630.1 aspartate--ammonia ligase [Eubacterium sp.]
MNIYPKGYQSSLTQRETQKAIKTVKDTFQTTLAKTLELDRITAPLIVTKSSGINDDLNGVERKVHFTMKNVEGEAEVVQSLAKWKRQALYRYGYKPGEGIYTDMNAIRRDDDTDNLHSMFVDQWDWCKVISRENRNIEFLKETVRKIVGAIYESNKKVQEQYPVLSFEMSRDVFFITTQELEDMFPDLSSKEREDAIVKEHGTVFLMQIGGKLRSGKKHDGRAPDYDDWKLNGDILVWNSLLECAFEISSMGIRVDSKSLHSQLEEENLLERENFEFHKNILNETYPLTIGGGIGQSRLCMLLLQKAHIGEVQCSIWSDEMREECREHNIVLL